MKKVYLLIDSWACDYENGRDIKIYSTKEKAMEEFNNKIKEFNGVVYNTIDKSKDSFEAFNEGEYAENHTYIYIEEKEVL